MSNHFENPICPNCGHVIEEDDTIDEYSDVGGINFTVVGTCPNCGKYYRWTDHYEHIYNCNLVEEEEEEED